MRLEYAHIIGWEHNVVTTESEHSSTVTADGLGHERPLKIVSSYCGNGTCPTIYESDRGTLVVQGYAVDTARAGVDVPAGELLVEIPIELLADAARRFPSS